MILRSDVTISYLTQEILASAIMCLREFPR